MRKRDTIAAIRQHLYSGWEWMIDGSANNFDGSANNFDGFANDSREPMMGECLWMQNEDLSQMMSVTSLRKQ